jgi:hypothetical protein
LRGGGLARGDGCGALACPSLARGVPCRIPGLPAAAIAGVAGVRLGRPAGVLFPLAVRRQVTCTQRRRPRGVIPLNRTMAGRGAAPGRVAGVPAGLSVLCRVLVGCGALLAGRVWRGVRRLRTEQQGAGAQHTAQRGQPTVGGPASMPSEHHQISSVEGV